MCTREGEGKETFLICPNFTTGVKIVFVCKISDVLQNRECETATCPEITGLRAFFQDSESFTALNFGRGNYLLT